MSEEIKKMALAEVASKQPAAVKSLLLDCPDNYARLVENVTDIDLECAIKIIRKYLAGNETRLLAMEEELEKRQKKVQNYGQDKEKNKINQCPKCKTQAEIKKGLYGILKENGTTKNEIRFYIKCDKCKTSTKWYTNKSLAIKEWNKKEDLNENN